jgi:16S rRNA (guanine527-N7)-methyltransferase
VTGSETALVEAMSLQSDELDKLRVFDREIRRWSSVKNLVSARALTDLWIRHVLDSAQVQRSAPGAKTWVDLGSGGGFPGIVTAILLSGDCDALVHLVESDNRKCAFLRSVSRETGIRTEVHHGRIEDIVPELPRADAVSARALAEMDQLVEWAGPLLERGALGVFQKGKSVVNELTRLTADSRFNIELRPSISQPDGVIVLVRRDIPLGANP